MVVDIILAPERNLQEGHQFALVHQEVLDDRAKGQCGEECKSTDQNDGPYKQPDKERTMCR